MAVYSIWWLADHPEVLPLRVSGGTGAARPNGVVHFRGVITAVRPERRNRKGINRWYRVTFRDGGYTVVYGTGAIWV